MGFEAVHTDRLDVATAVQIKGLGTAAANSKGPTKAGASRPVTGQRLKYTKSAAARCEGGEDDGGEAATSAHNRTVGSGAGIGPREAAAEDGDGDCGLNWPGRVRATP